MRKLIDLLLSAFERVGPMGFSPPCGDLVAEVTRKGEETEAH